MQERQVVSIDGWQGPASVPAIAAGGFIFTSGVTGAGADGRVVSPDVGAQTRRAIERLQGILREAGSSLGQVVSVNVYLRRASDFETLNAVYRDAFAERPPTRTTVVTELAGDAQVMVSAIAVPDGAHREVLHPAGWMKSPRPYSYIVRAGGLVFLSGLVSRRGTDDQPVPGPVATQTTTILDNAGVLLRTAGLSFSDVVAAKVFLTDGSQFEAMNDEYRPYVGSQPPARATAVTGLMGASTLVEIQIVASAVGRQIVGPAVAPSLPLSSAVRAGDLLFLSGVLGHTDANTDDVAAQSQEVFARIRRTLDQAGLSVDHVVDNLIYVTDPWQRGRVEAVCREQFAAGLPASTLVGAKLVTRAGLVEMMMTAAGR